MKITKNILEKIIREEITTLLSEGQPCANAEECLGQAMQKNAAGDARGAFVNLVRALNLKGVL